MKQRLGLAAIALLTGLFAFSPAMAQRPDDAQWIWLDVGDPLKEAPAGTVWFRHEVRSDSPSTGAVRILCDDHFVLWVNNQKIGEGGADRVYRFTLSGIVGRGPNVIAVEATNKGGPAGLYIDGEVRTQGGRYYRFDGGPQWRATSVRPQGDAWRKPGFDTSAWSPVKVLGPHEKTPWRHIELKETYLDRFAVAEGFKLERIAEPNLVGSLVAITWGNRGRLIASRERGPILSVIDSDGDGRFDKVVEYSNQVTNCQGLCMVFDDLYAVGQGPRGTGVYRLPDRNHDDRADSVEVVHLHVGRYGRGPGIGEHGPHDVVFGPDGWLYHNLGNHAWIGAKPEPTSGSLVSYEGTLLQPKFEDARGHARGIGIPGGSIWRFTPDGAHWYREVVGFRNEYDIAFRSDGELFTFDSDMEWDVGMPWYRPVRVNHCVPGAEFGWRSGCAKWPDYYFDSLPSVVDVGRGSPTGVVFYEHRQFPKQYRGRFLICDWSMGRILSVALEPQGASFTGRFENLVTGNPLNVSDIEVDRDGSVIFATGGRGTEGGVYRVSYPGGDTTPAKADNLAQLLDLPQFQAAWAREIALEVKRRMGDAWQTELEKVVRSGAPDHRIRALTLLAQLGPAPEPALLIETAGAESPAVRAFAALLLGNHRSPQVAQTLAGLLADADPRVRRRACEAFVHSGLEAPVEPLLELMGSDDRWLRYAARTALERVPADRWRKQVLASRNPWVVTHGLLALHHVGALDPVSALKAEADLLEGRLGSLTPQQTVDVMRMVGLTLIAGGRSPAVGTIAQRLRSAFPSGHWPVDAEAARLLAFLQVPEAVPMLLEAMQRDTDQAHQIHYALCLRYLNVGWNLASKKKLLDWYEGTRNWEGGHSFGPYLANIVGACLDRYRPDERTLLLAEWKQRPFATGLLLGRSRPEQFGRFEETLKRILEEKLPPPIAARREELLAQAIEALGRGGSPAAQQILRNLYDQYPDHREGIVRVLANYPNADNWPYYVRSLRFGDPTTLQLCLRALRKTRKKPEKPEQIRAVILAAQKLDDRQARIAVALLKQWTNTAPENPDDVKLAVAHYRDWFQRTYPDQPPAELPKVDRKQTKYTFEQLYNFLERDPRGRAGDPERGRKVFARATCIKCHRFLNEGENVGPDLTTVRRRFQRKEIIESIVYPSQVISDQYRMVTIITDDGVVYNGMPIPSASDDKNVVLLLQDASKVTIPRSSIEEMAPSKVSVMPVGVLKELSLQDIADLFAFLETSRFNEDVAGKPATKSEGGSGQ